MARLARPRGVDPHPPPLPGRADVDVDELVVRVVAAAHVGLLPAQMFALAVATVLVAGLCVWIIGWEDEEQEEA